MVVGHGVPDSQITTTRQSTIDFLALPGAERMKVARPPVKISCGYNWVGDRSLFYTLGQTAPPDLPGFGALQIKPPVLPWEL